MGISSMTEGVRRGVGGTRGAPGLGGVAQGYDGGIGGGDGGGGAREDDTRVRASGNGLLTAQLRMLYGAVEISQD